MRAYDIILKKREGKTLTAEEINFLIKGYTEGKIPDYQMSAWSMAVYFQGMHENEIAVLTEAMANSGDKLDLSKIRGKVIDKHSTGGVGDTTSLILIPLVAAAGVPVAKMSGRGLGHTGGTIDKLESIPGFRTDLSLERFINNVNKIGMAISGHTANLTPADKKLYALRDVTATVDSIPLIASSIMSKKIAGGADGIVLDVKTGSGAFMKNLTEARKLAETMVAIGKQVNKQTTAIISSMDQPLGNAVGNSLEVIEAVNTLAGEGPQDMEKLCFTLGAHMLIMAGEVEDFAEGYYRLEKILQSGKGLKKFAEFIVNQGGNPGIIEDFNILPRAEQKIKLYCKNNGYISALNALAVGTAAMLSGAGREQKGDNIDPAAGVYLHKKYGEKVHSGDLLAVLHSNKKEEDLQEAVKILKKAFQVSKNKPEKLPLIYGTF